MDWRRTACLQSALCRCRRGGKERRRRPAVGLDAAAAEERRSASSVTSPGSGSHLSCTDRQSRQSRHRPQATGSASSSSSCGPSIHHPKAVRAPWEPLPLRWRTSGLRRALPSLRNGASSCGRCAGVAPHPAREGGHPAGTKARPAGELLAMPANVAIPVPWRRVPELPQPPHDRCTKR